MADSGGTGRLQAPVLVTGGAGFIGRHLVAQLVADGNRVRVFDLATTHGFGSDVEAVQGSICDRAAVDTAMAGIGQLYHLAGDPNLWARNKESFLETNYRGTCTVLEAAARQGVARIVHTSTESILRGRRRAETTDESAVATIDDMPGPYCRSKFLAERAALAAAASGLPVVVVNPTLPVGPGDSRLTPPTRMLLGFLNGEIGAYLDFRLNMIDVRDAARGHVLAAKHGRTGERYILSGENLTLGQVLVMLRELTGLAMPKVTVPYWLAFAAAAVSETLADWITRSPPMAPLTGVRLAGSATAFSNAKARRELGLVVTPVRAALADAISWMAANGLLRRPMRADGAPRPASSAQEGRSAY